MYIVSHNEGTDMVSALCGEALPLVNNGYQLLRIIMWRVRFDMCFS